MIFLLGKDFLHRTQKQAIQKIRKLDFTKERNVFFSKDSIRKIKKGKPQTGREYFQSIYLTKSIYPEYIKSSYNLIIKNRHKIQVAISPNKHIKANRIYIIS